MNCHSPRVFVGITLAKQDFFLGLNRVEVVRLAEQSRQAETNITNFLSQFLVTQEPRRNWNTLQMPHSQYVEELVFHIGSSAR